MRLTIAGSDEQVEIGSFRDFYAFEQHVSTCRKRRGLEMVPQWYEQPVFYFSNHRSLVAHDSQVYAPAGCRELDFELELGIVIGKPGRDIAEQDAWKHVLGFTIINDLSARDLQRSEMKVGLGPAKGKDFASAVGPLVVPLAAVESAIDAQNRISLSMSCQVNGRRLSSGNSQDMFFTWPQLIAHASRDAKLDRGDLLGSGTVGSGCILELGPENVGGWLQPGDTIEMEIEQLGQLSTQVVDRP